jgi:MerR family redox-sensitive transcriptional activator SoxR
MSDQLLTIGELARPTGVATSALRYWEEAELDDQIAKAQTAREAIDHALRCPHKDILECPNFGSVIAARISGQPLHQAHPH